MLEIPISMEPNSVSSFTSRKLQEFGVIADRLQELNVDDPIQGGEEVINKPRKLAESLKLGRQVGDGLLLPHLAGYQIPKLQQSETDRTPLPFGGLRRMYSVGMEFSLSVSPVRCDSSVAAGELSFSDKWISD